MRDGDPVNVALRRPADQSSVSPYSTAHLTPALAGYETRISGQRVGGRGLKLAEDLAAHGVDAAGIDAPRCKLSASDGRRCPQMAPASSAAALFLEAHWVVRRLALSNPLLDFDDLLFVKRCPARSRTCPTSTTAGSRGRAAGCSCWRTSRRRRRVCAA